MINILLTGVGGQGTVLAAKILALAASTKGWKARTAETIGMAQRGGSVISHVRIGNLGEDVHAPLVTQGSADLIIAFEPGEAARVLPYLSKTGTIVTATTTVEPVSAAIGDVPYDAKQILENIQLSLYNAMVKSITRGKTRKQLQSRLVPVTDAAIIAKLGGNRKVLNSIMLAVAVSQNVLPLSLDDLTAAVSACVKPQFVEMNIRAIEAALEGGKSNANEA